MAYTQAQQSKILQKIIAKVRYEIEIACENDEINELLDKYVVSLEEGCMPVNRRTHKILVFGDLAGKENDYKRAAKKIGINEKQLEFISDFKELKRFNTTNLAYSNVYSDIIYGPNPHKQVGIGDHNSFLSAIKNEPQKYPRVIEAKANSELKITISNFKDALFKTRLIENDYC